MYSDFISELMHQFKTRSTIPDRDKLGDRSGVGDSDPGVVVPLLSPSETPNPGTASRFSLDTPVRRNRISWGAALGKMLIVVSHLCIRKKALGKRSTSLQEMTVKNEETDTRVIRYRITRHHARYQTSYFATGYLKSIKSESLKRNLQYIIK